MITTKVANSQAGAEKLTVREAIKDLGWFSGFYATFVGAPSVLDVVQSVLVEHRLVAVFQWVVDTYHKLVVFLGDVFGPVLVNLFRLLNRVFNWQLELQPHWKSLFVMAMVLVISLVRATRRYKDLPSSIAFGVGGGIGALLGAAGAGLFSPAGDWVDQGLATAAPIVAMLVSISIVAAIGSVSGFGEDSSISLGPLYFGIIVAGMAAFVFGAFVSIIPFVTLGGSVLSTGLMVFGLGWLALAAGLSDRNLDFCRLGLTILGGFVVAGVVLIADFVAKMFGA